MKQVPEEELLKLMNGPLHHQVEKYKDREAELNLKLKQEKNLVLLPMVDTYKNLTLKVVEGYRWVLKNTDAKWIMKVDDDSFVDIEMVKQFLFDKIPKFTIIGKVASNVTVISSNKNVSASMRRWVDRDYQKPVYPDYCNGAAGHIVSRDIAEYIVDNADSLIRYVLE